MQPQSSHRGVRGYSRPAANLVRNLAPHIPLRECCIFAGAVGASNGSRIIVCPCQVSAKLRGAAGVNRNGFWRTWCLEFRRCPARLIMELGLCTFVAHSLLRDTPVAGRPFISGRFEPCAHLHRLRAALLAHNPTAASTVVLATNKQSCKSKTAKDHQIV